MLTRRDFMMAAGALAAGGAAIGTGRAASAQGAGGHGEMGSAPPSPAPHRAVEMTPGAVAPPARTQVPPRPPGGAYRPVVTPNGSSLPWQWKDGVKEFRLVAEPVVREFAPGMVVNCWGYNGQTPGPTIEAVEGDRVRIYVTNKLPEWTAIHWHAIRLPNGMDGVAGLTQPPIPSGRTGVYEFTLRDSGTFMYHPHADEMVQMAMGLMGFFVVHPKDPAERAVERDFCIMLHAWDVVPGTATPRPATMLDFNMWTFNSRVWPGTDPLPVRLGDRVRIRIANLSMTSHPIHIHGHHFKQVATDGGWLSASAQWPLSTVNVPVGATTTMEFVADAPGDWGLHCHKTHHTMNAMGHDIPNMIGVNQAGLDRKIATLLPAYMAMGSSGMAGMAEMQAPLAPNTLPMKTGTGPFGPIEMGGMFTILKVREGLAPDDYADPGWYAHPRGTVSYLLDE